MTAAEDAVRIAEAVVVKPGDTLVLSLAGAMNPEQVREILAQVQAKMPDGVKALLVGGDIQLYVLRPGDES